MPDRQTIRITWGGGLDRESGIAQVEPASFADLRNVELLRGTAQARKGMSQTTTLFLDGLGVVGMTDVVFLTALRATRQGAVLAHDAASGEVQLFITNALGAGPDFRHEWFAQVGAGNMKAHAAEVYRKLFFAHDRDFAGGRAVTKFYDADTTGTTTLQANLDGAGTNPIQFRGVHRHLNYLFGWGFGTTADPDRPELVRASLPGQPTVFNREHYFLVGARGDPVVALASLPGVCLAFKETEIYPLRGTNRANFGVYPAVDSYFGLAAPKLWVVVGGVCYFWSVQGPRITAGGESTDISLPLNLEAPEPSDLIASGAVQDGFAVYSAATRQVRFHFGRRCYALHLRDPSNPRWSYDERGRSVNCGGEFYGATDTPGSTSRLQLFYGEDGGNGIFRDNQGHQDYIEAIPVRASSDPVAPAGLERECVFPTFYLSVTHTMAITLRVTPYVDGVALPFRDLNYTSKAERTTEVAAIALSTSPDAQKRNHPRGTWFAVKVATLVAGVPAIATGDLLFDQSTLEYEDVGARRAA